MHFFYKRSHSIILNPHNTTFLPLRPQKNLSQPSITIIFSYYSPLYIWIEAIVFLTLLIFSPFTKKRSLFTLSPITAPQDFWRSNTGCDHSIPTRRSLFTLSPNYSTAGFLRVEPGCDHDIPTKRSLFTLSPITAPPNFFPGGLTIDRWTWYPDDGNL